MVEYDIKEEKNKITVKVKLKKRSGRDRLICVTTNAILNYLNEQKINLKGYGLPDCSAQTLDNESGPWERTLIFSKNILDKPKKNVVSSNTTKNKS
tara:strand:+ start:562 stop:849 length:288 start_codon:yes stop_codon:yes gene_type:complete